MTIADSIHSKSGCIGPDSNTWVPVTKSCVPLLSSRTNIGPIIKSDMINRRIKKGFTRATMSTVYWKVAKSTKTRYGINQIPHFNTFLSKRERHGALPPISFRTSSTQRSFPGVARKRVSQIKNSEIGHTAYKKSDSRAPSSVMVNTVSFCFFTPEIVLMSTIKNRNRNMSRLNARYRLHRDAGWVSLTRSFDESNCFWFRSASFWRLVRSRSFKQASQHAPCNVGPPQYKQCMLGFHQADCAINKVLCQLYRCGTVILPFPLENSQRLI